MAAITQVQAPTQLNSSANPQVYTFGGVPTAGNIIVANVGQQQNPPTPTDSIGDSGGAKTAWAVVPGLQNLAGGGGGMTYTQFWRVVGNSPSGTTVSVANGAGGNCAIDIGEWSSSDTGTWGVDGTPVTASGTAANPSGGNITTTGNAFINCHFTTAAGGSPLPGIGYTRNFVGAGGVNREAQEWGEFDSTTNATDWIFLISDYMIFAAAFRKFSSGSRPVKMAGEWGGFAGTSGGFAG